MLSRTLNLQEQSSNLSLLKDYLQQLVGQRFLQIRFSYGDEVTVHLGEPTSYSSPSLKDLVKGSYVIGAMASDCFLSSPSQPVQDVLPGVSALPASYTLITPEQTELIHSIPDYFQVVQVRPFTLVDKQGFGLFLKLDEVGGMKNLVPANRIRNGLTAQKSVSVVIVPDPDSEDLAWEDEPLADWEVMTPDNRYLRVGPSLNWSYLPSD